MASWTVAGHEPAALTRRRLAGALLVVLLLTLVAIAGGPAPGIASSDQQDLIIGFEVDGGHEHLLGVIEESGGEVVRINDALRYILVRTCSPEALTAVLACHAGVRYVEPNRTVTCSDGIAYVPNEGDGGRYEQQWNLPNISVPQAWDLEMGKKTVIIAIVDSGVDYNHPDLAANYLPGGRNWVADPANPDTGDPLDPMDDNGHGTFCAGIAAAVTNNGAGIAGIAQVHFMAEKVLNSEGKGLAEDVAQGIRHAVDAGADIINLSLGQPEAAQVTADACQYAWNHGCLVVAAAGNDDTLGIYYPAALDRVICVGATDVSDTRWTAPGNYGSNWGPQMDLCGPGASILSTKPGNAYQTMSGTSAATPHIAGVAALLWSRQPGLTNLEIRGILEGTADDLGTSGFDNYFGWGKVNALRALKAIVPGITSVVPSRGCPGESMTATIAGVNLAQAQSVGFGPGITVSSFTPRANQIDVTLQIGISAVEGTRDITVTTPAGIAMLPGGFTVAPNTAPSTPSNKLPESGSSGVSAQPALTASAFQDPDIDGAHQASEWRISLEAGPGAEDVLSAVTGPLTSYQVPGDVLQGDTTYYWSVRYQDNHSHWSEWSDPTSFTTDPAPARPANVNPANDAHVDVLNPVLTSSAFDDPGDSHESSQWQVRAAGGTYGLPDFYSGSTPLYKTSITIPFGKLKYATKYYWRVRYQDGNDVWSAWSEETCFFSPSRIPATPSNVSPSDTKIVPGPAVVLTASAFSDPDAGDSLGASQWLVIPAGGDWASPLLDVLVEGSTSCSIPDGTLQYDCTYYWRVRYSDSCGAWSLYSTPTSFSVAKSAPAQPANLLPANRAECSEASPTLTTSDFDDPDGRCTHLASQWQVTLTQGDYSKTVFDSGRSLSALVSIQLPEGLLQQGKAYYWRVRYQNNHGNWSEYSAETYFVAGKAASPAAMFEASVTRGKAPLRVDFLDQSTGVCDGWAWDFDNDGTVDSEERNPSFTYSKPGTYTVTLTVSGPAGESTETKTGLIVVGESAQQKGGLFSCGTSSRETGAWQTATGLGVLGLCLAGSGSLRILRRRWSGRKRVKHGEPPSV